MPLVAFPGGHRRSDTRGSPEIGFFEEDRLAAQQHCEWTIAAISFVEVHFREKRSGKVLSTIGYEAVSLLYNISHSKRIYKSDKG